MRSNEWKIYKIKTSGCGHREASTPPPSPASQCGSILAGFFALLLSTKPTTVSFQSFIKAAWYISNCNFNLYLERQQFPLHYLSFIILLIVIESQSLLIKWWIFFLLSRNTKIFFCTFTAWHVLVLISTQKWK